MQYKIYGKISESDYKKLKAQNNADIKKQVEQIFKVDLSESNDVKLFGVTFTKDEMEKMQQPQNNPIEDEPVLVMDDATKDTVAKLFRVDKKDIKVDEPAEDVVYVVED